jgi:hypothetical protein
MTTKPVRSKLTMKRSKAYTGEFQVYDLFLKGKELMSEITVFSDNRIQLSNYKDHKKGYVQVAIGAETIE